MDLENYSYRLNKVIPGGAHTYSRGDDQYPSNAPQLLERGKGAFVYSADGRKFIDYGMALRATTLGYSNDEVNKAAWSEIEKGNNLTRASLTELEAAELIVNLVPGADMVKFAKNGSNVTTAAIKLARSYTGRKYIAYCAEHPFFSFDDWFIGSTVLQRGVPEQYQSLSLKFNFNRIDSLKQLFDQYPGEIAAVILEPASTLSPCSISCKGDIFKEQPCEDCVRNHNNFLHQIKELCSKNGTVFILDEMITGFRWHLQGAQKYFDIEPDLSTFGKGMANGFSVAALVGKKEIMNLGGIKEQGLERTFLVSTTHGGEMSGLGAFIKTVEIYKRENVIHHLWSFGEKLKTGINKISQDFGIGDFFYLEGYPCSPNYIAKDKQGNVSLGLRTLFSQEMIKEGVLIPWISVSYSHNDAILAQTLSAVEKALRVYRDALETSYENYLVGEPIKPVFRKYN